MSSVLAEAKRYLWRYGVNTDTTVEPVELIRDLTTELEDRVVELEIRVMREAQALKKKPRARAK
jgi:hypothetical protein